VADGLPGWRFTGLRGCVVGVTGLEPVTSSL
jgi:hypothetical protein